MEKMIKIQEDSEKASRKVELKIFEMVERRQKESQDFQMRLLSLLQTSNIQPQVSNIHGTSNMQAQDLSCVTIIYIFVIIVNTVILYSVLIKY